MSSSNCCFLTYIRVSQEAGQVVWYSHLFQNFPQFIVIHTLKGLGIVNKAEIDVFLELSCFFDDPANVGNLISSSSAFSKTSLNIWKCSLEGLMLKLKLQYFGHLMWRADSFEKTLKLGKIEGREEKGTTEDEMVGWHHQLNGHEFEKTGRWWRTGKPGILQSMRSQRVGHDWATEQQQLLRFRLEKHFQSFL